MTARNPAKTEPPPDDHITAPWPGDQVDALNRYQRSGVFHEFTCIEQHPGLDRTLYATREGWRCCHCAYRQDWAHASMLLVPPLAPVLTLPCDVMLPPATVLRKGVSYEVLQTAFNARAVAPADQNRFDDAARTSSLASASDMFRNPLPVTVTGGDYKYEGALCGIAWKASGVVRYVVEDPNGRLFIHNAKQLGKAEGWVP